MNPSFEEQVKHFQNWKARITKGAGPGPKAMYLLAINDIEDMASGGDAGGIRHTYYEGWGDDDFKALLGEVNRGP